MTASLRKKLEKARKVEGIRHELETYTLAVAANGKFSDYYKEKILKLQKKLEAL
jgi:hypothetical protein